VRRVVLDVGVLLSWFDADGPGRTIRAEYEAGQLTVVAPRTIVADALGVLAHRPGWAADRLERAATELGRLGLELRDPPVADVARYVARGLPADRAAYPALAAALDLRLETNDPRLRSAAGAIIGS
jgi:predicted nucleic acid-binding protein